MKEQDELVKFSRRDAIIQSVKMPFALKSAALARSVVNLYEKSVKENLYTKLGDQISPTELETFLADIPPDEEVFSQELECIPNPDILSSRTFTLDNTGPTYVELSGKHALFPSVDITHVSVFREGENSGDWLKSNWTVIAPIINHSKKTSHMHHLGNLTPGDYRLDVKKVESSPDFSLSKGELSTVKITQGVAGSEREKIDSRTPFVIPDTDHSISTDLLLASGLINHHQSDKFLLGIYGLLYQEGVNYAGATLKEDWRVPEESKFWDRIAKVINSFHLDMDIDNYWDTTHTYRDNDPLSSVKFMEEGQAYTLSHVDSYQQTSYQNQDMADRMEDFKGEFVENHLHPILIFNNINNSTRLGTRDLLARHACYAYRVDAFMQKNMWDWNLRTLGGDESDAQEVLSLVAHNVDPSDSEFASIISKNGYVLPARLQ